MSWDLNGYDNPVTKDFIRGLYSLADSKKHLIYKDSGIVSLMLKDRVTRKKLIEYWPVENLVLNTRDNHQSMAISGKLTDRYHEEIANSGKPLKDPKVFLALLEEILSDLESKRKPG